MSRITGDAATEAQASVNRWCYLVSLAFPSGTLYLTDGPKQYSYGGNTYVRGTLMGLKGINERSDGRPGQCSIDLAFTDQIRTKLQDDYQFSDVMITFAFLDENFDLHAEFDLAAYEMSNAPRQLGQNTTISLICEPVVAAIYNANPVYPSNRDQQARYANDTIFNGSSVNEGWEFEWAGQKYIGGSPRGNGASGRHGSSGHGPHSLPNVPRFMMQ